VPDPELVARIADWVVRTHLDTDPEPVETETCLYTNTNDERFILERHGRIVVGSACSGHGFKFAPVVGARLAELAAAKV
jgi:sarcosine oxidase